LHGRRRPPTDTSLTLSQRRHLLGFLPRWHMRHARSGSHGRCLARHLPSPGFGYPLDGLLPRAPRRPCFMPTAPVGFSLRSILLGRGCPAFPPSLAPLAVAAKPPSSTEVDKTSLEARLPGTASTESLVAARVFSPTGAGGSLGISPSQGSSALISARASARLLPRDCPPGRLLGPAFPASESLSINALSDQRGPDVPLRVFAPRRT